MNEAQKSTAINEICWAIRNKRLKQMTAYRKKLNAMSKDELRDEYNRIMEKLK